MSDRAFLVSKSTVSRVFVGGAVVILVGLVIELFALASAIAGGLVVIGGPSVITVNPGQLAPAVAGFAVGGLLIGGGSVAGVVAWVGALFNTARLADKTWFVALLVLGLVSFGVVAMIAYVLAGPDDARGVVDRGGLPSVAASPEGGA